MAKLFSRPFHLLFFLVCLFFVSGIPNQARADDGREDDHKALRKLLVEATTAFNNHDLKLFSSYFAKNYVFIGIDQSVQTSEQELQAHYDQLFNAPNAPLADVKIEPQYSKPTVFIDQNTGFCYGTTIETYTLKNGESMKIQSHWTATLVKESDQWKVATLHFGVNLLDNPILNKATSSMKITGIISFLVGLVFGIFGIKLLCRSKKA